MYAFFRSFGIEVTHDKHGVVSCQLIHHLYIDACAFFTGNNPVIVQMGGAVEKYLSGVLILKFCPNRYPLTSSVPSQSGHLRVGSQEIIPPVQKVKIRGFKSYCQPFSFVLLGTFTPPGNHRIFR